MLITHRLAFIVIVGHADGRARFAARSVSVSAYNARRSTVGFTMMDAQRLRYGSRFPWLSDYDLY